MLGLAIVEEVKELLVEELPLLIIAQDLAVLDLSFASGRLVGLLSSV